MPDRYLETLFTPDVLAAQARYHGRSQAVPQAGHEPLGPDEIEHIARGDSFYLATVSSDGWPYLQHRGGPPGFLHALDDRTLAFADLKGNRQLLSTGNLAGNDRVALLLMDYPRRTRLKILGHARVLDAREHRELADRLAPSPELRSRVERLFVIDVVAFDWNCPQHITPRYTAAEVEKLVAPLRRRLAELEGGKADGEPGGR